jgi:hypothetical protein
MIRTLRRTVQKQNNNHNTGYRTKSTFPNSKITKHNDVPKEAKAKQLFAIFFREDDGRWHVASNWYKIKGTSKE